MRSSKYLWHLPLHFWVGLLIPTVLSSRQSIALPHNENDSNDTADVSLNEIFCSSPGCLNMGSQMFSLMDHNVSSCEDFYQFACGGLTNHSDMLEHTASSDVDKKLRVQIQRVRNTRPYQQLKRFYDSCISSRRSTNEVEARKVVAKVGSFHNKNSWTTSSLSDLLSKLLLVGSTPLFDVLLDVSDDDVTKFDLKLVVSVKKSLLLPDTDECLEKGHAFSQHTYNECKQKDTPYFVGRVSDALQALYYSPVEGSETSANELQATIMCLQDIIPVIQKYTPFESDIRRDLASRNYRYMSIAELQDKYPLIEWKKLFNSLLSQDVNIASKVQVYFEHYFDMVFRHLSEVEPRLLYNALLAKFVTELYFDVVKHEPVNRKVYCLAITKHLLSDVASSMYLQTFPNDTAEQVEEVFDSVKRVLQAQINSSNWLDEQSRQSSLDKLEALEVVAGGGRDVLGNVRLLEQRMRGYDVNENEFVNNTIKLLQRKRKLAYAAYSENTTDSQQIWLHFISPIDSTQPIFYHSNKIIVPYTMLPVRRLSKAMSQFKTAETGFMLATLIAHHFDSTGLDYNSKGVKENILSTGQAKNYSSVKDCFWKQVSKQDRTVIKYRRDQLQAVNDVIADLAAVNMAFEAFQKDNGTKRRISEDGTWKQTGRQLFFLSVAQTLCEKTTTWDSQAPVDQRITLPPSARIMALVSQSDAFAKAFNCTCASEMSLPDDERCPTFPLGHVNKPPADTPQPSLFAHSVN